MKFLSSILIPCVAVLALSQPAWAQDSDPEMMPEGSSKTEPKAAPKTEPKAEPAPKKRGKQAGRRGLKEMRERIGKLGLSPDQMKSFGQLFQDLRKAAREARDSGNRQGIRQARQKFEKSVRELLTPEQLEKWQGMRPETQGARGRGRGKRRPGQRGMGAASTEEKLQEIKKILVLSPTQESVVMPQVKTVLEKLKTHEDKLKSARRNLLEALREGMTAEQLEARMGKFRKGRDESEAAIKSAQEELAKGLDKEQKAKLVALGVLR